MPQPARPADRYDPLPGLLGLPRFLLDKLSPRGRRVVLGVAAGLIAAAVVAVMVYGPRIAESNRERADQQRLAERRAAAQELARLRAEQRPRTGRLAGGSFVAGVERAITRDARARATTGELETRARRTDCHSIGHDGPRTLLACTAVTSDVGATAHSGAVLIGYPYRAAVSPPSGRYAICKTSGRAGEGSYTRRVRIELPRACGG